MRATALLSWWQFRNSFRTLFSDPRKLGPLLVLVLVLAPSLGMLMILPSINQSISSRGGPSPSIDQAIYLAYASLFVVFFSLWGLLNGVGDGSVAFPLSDVDFLFPSPISRRTVLSARLPKLWLGILLLSAFAFALVRMFTSMFEPNLAMGLSLKFYLGLALSYGFFFTVGLNASIRIVDRTRVTKIFGYVILAGLAGVAIVNLVAGTPGVIAVASSEIVSWIVKPAFLAVGALQPASTSGVDPLSVLALLWLVSTVGLYVGQSNFYEQSIASSFKFARMRAAAKTGGFAGLKAIKAENYKRKSDKTYTVRPFGQGAMALFWAHLCSAAKTPTQNFLTPVLAGIALGVALAVCLGDLASFGLTIAIVGPFYAATFLIAAARAAGEGSLRRRDLVSPLPVPCSSVVLADLGVPLIGGVILGITAAIAYGLMANFGTYHPLFHEAPFYVPPWTAIVLALALLFPIRVGPRMAIQYLMVLAYPDRSDKLQIMFSGCLTNLLMVPFLLMEAIVCVPAILFHSVWLGLITVIVLNSLILWLIILMAGRAVQRSLSTGEPVHMGDLLRSSRA